MSKIKSYLDRLSALSLDQTMLDSDRLVLFLSGSSDITCAGLTAGQLDLLHAICPSGYSVVASNFPFNQDFEHIKSPQVGHPSKIACDSAWPGFPSSLKSKRTRATGHQRKERSLFTHSGSPLSGYSSGYGSL